jgi:hypothetical protein
MSKDSKRTKKATVSEDSKLKKKGTVSSDSKLAVKTAAPDNPTEKSVASSDNKPADKSAASDESQLTEETTVANDVKPIEKGAAGDTSGFDFTKLMSQFPLPGVNFATLVDREQKNIEALTKANRIAFEGWQRLVRRQAEMLRKRCRKWLPTLAC